MKHQILSHNIFRALFVVSLLTALALNGQSPVKASYPGLSIISWGVNYLPVNMPADLTDVSAIAAGYMHSLALKDDGTVVGWGSNDTGQISIPTGLNGVVAISAGEWHSLALKSDGTVVAWGNNQNGQLNIPSGLSDVIAISAGASHNLALKSDGTVVAWGANWYGQATVPSNLTGVVAIAAGQFQSLALKSDGTVVGWGEYRYGAINIPAGLTDVVAISSGYMHGLALKSDGTVVGWGDNGYGETSIPANLTGVTAISAAGYRSVALKNDGTVIGWGNNLSGQTNVPTGLSGVVAFAAGPSHALAIGKLSNTAPTANAGGPYLGAVNTSIQFDGSLSSDPENNPLTYAWDFGDGAIGTSAAPTHIYNTAGVYDVTLSVSDGSLSSETISTWAVVYDPSAGFVTGGGSIDSPAGAYKGDETLAGKATFAFMSKYQKGASVPTGNTAFQFDLGGLSFTSTSYEWLVVNQAATNAQFKGEGLINGLTDDNGNPYKFMLSAGDGSPDTFRMRIWSESSGEETVVYDTGNDQPITAGNIVVHTSK